MDTASRERLRWLGQLRWWALAGAMAGVLIALARDWAFVSAPAVVLGVVVMAFVNTLLVWRSRQRDDGSEEHGASDELVLHALADFALLTWLLAWAGGVRNPIAVIYSF